MLIYCHGDDGGQYEVVGMRKQLKWFWQSGLKQECS